MNTVAFIAAVIIGLMLSEWRLSRRNEAVLRAHGAIRPAPDRHAVVAGLHPGAFLAMAIEGVWRAASAAGTPSDGPAWVVSGALLFVASKGLKYWAIQALGVRWTLPMWVLPGQPLVRSGPYRYVAHPNDIAVIGETVGAAMMMGARITGPLSIVLVGLSLVARVRFENRVLATGE